MILGIGVDLIEVERIGKAVEKERFFQRVYCEEEREYIASHGKQTAAGFFAAKEAVAKALGTGFTGFGPQAIVIVHDELGAPRVTLTGGALARFEALGGQRIHLSITHVEHNAAAFAIIEG